LDAASGLIGRLEHGAGTGDHHRRNSLVDPAAEHPYAGRLRLPDHGMGVAGCGLELLTGEGHRAAGEGDQVLRHRRLLSSAAASSRSPGASLPGRTALCSVTHGSSASALARPSLTGDYRDHDRLTSW